jgi:hypothetical protein
MLVNYVKYKKAKKEVVAKILKVDDKKKKYDEDVEKVKKETWPFTDKRKQLMEPYEPEEEKDPLEVAIKEKNEGDSDALYDKHIDDTAKVLYSEGVCKHSEDANNQYTQILNGLGLKPNLAQGQDPQPSIEKIKKALSL